jgi:hypothetical protein
MTPHPVEPTRTFARRWTATGTSMRSRACSRLMRCGICPSRILGSTRAQRRSVTSPLATGRPGRTIITRSKRFSTSCHGVLSVAIREEGWPRGSDARVQARHLQVFEWVQGEIVRITCYSDIDAARAADERLAEERG